MLKRVPLFPPCLNSQTAAGERSQGPAVVIIQLLLQALSHSLPIGDRWPWVEITGVYDEHTEVAVRRLQAVLGFTGDQVDGHFGPITRLRLKERNGIDVDSLTTTVPTEFTRWVDDSGVAFNWPQ